MIINDWLRNILGTQSQLKPNVFQPPVFITGCMRSGTTMLVNKLSQHPELLKVGGELNEIWTEIGGAPINSGNLYRDESHASYEFANNMTNYFARSIEDSKSLKRYLMRSVYLWKAGGGRLSYDWDLVRVLNKSPHLINKTKYLKSLFPKSKIILIVRPIHEQVSSLKMHYLKTGQKRALPVSEKDSWRDPSANLSDDISVFPEDFKALPLMWLRLNKIAIDDLESMEKGSYHIVNYHDLVNKQGECLNQIFEFLELSEKHQSTANMIVEKNIKIFNTSTSGDPQQKWKKHLTDEEKGIIDQLIETNLLEYSKIENAVKKFSISAF